MAKPLSKVQVERIRQMRADGYTIKATAETVGCCMSTVRNLAPGRPGKVDNAALRAAFLTSGISASEVARRIGWFHSSSRMTADCSRVRRTLGINSDCNGEGLRSTRRFIDWETGSLIAEAIGVAAWSVLDDEQEMAA